MYDLLVVPGAEITQNHFPSRKNSHIIALNIIPAEACDRALAALVERGFLVQSRTGTFLRRATGAATPLSWAS